MIRHPALAVSLGDPAGVGPELICAAWVRRETDTLRPFFAVGGAVLLSAAARHRGLALTVQPIADPAEAAAVFPYALPVLGLDGAPYQPGQPSTAGAHLALYSLTHATQLALAGKASGVVTGPIAKARLADAGFRHPGQTEFVAQACKIPAENAVMLLAGPQLRTVPLTGHCALSAVPGMITHDLICNRTRITAVGLQRDFGIASPRIAICALNPHAGEEGRFGDEEQRIIAPAIATLRAEGIDATGPHPADSLFARFRQWGQHDAGPADCPHLARSRDRFWHCRHRQGRSGGHDCRDPHGRHGCRAPPALPRLITRLFPCRSTAGTATHL